MAPRPLKWGWNEGQRSPCGTKKGYEVGSHSKKRGKELISISSLGLPPQRSVHLVAVVSVLEAGVRDQGDGMAEAPEAPCSAPFTWLLLVCWQSLVFLGM